VRILRPIYPGRSDPVRRPSGMAGGASLVKINGVWLMSKNTGLTFT
jgi:hypothetical protein